MKTAAWLARELASGLTGFSVLTLGIWIWQEYVGIPLPLLSLCIASFVLAFLVFFVTAILDDIIKTRSRTMIARLDSQSQREPLLNQASESR